MVKNPTLINSEMYLNESHPTKDQGCEFHRQEEPQTYARPEQAEQPHGKSLIVTNMLREFESRTGKKYLTAERIVILVPLFICLLTLLASISFSLGGREKSEKAGVYVSNPLTYEEVMEAGIACDGLGHFKLLADTLIPEVDQLLSDFGYQWATPYQTEDNVECIVGTERTTRFEKYYNYDLTKGEHEPSEYDYVMLSSDTVTGQLHSAAIFLDQEDEIREILKKFFSLAEEAEGISGEDSTVMSLLEDFKLDEYGVFYYENDNYTFSLSEQDDGYYLTIY